MNQMNLEVINYLKQDVYNSIINDVRDIAIYHSRRKFKKKGGFFSIPRQVFCYVDFLGSIAYDNKSTTKNAIDFIKEYFPKERKYYELADLIYSMWRHGLVHEYAPKRIYCDDERLSIVGISWRSVNSAANRDRKDHLKICFRPNSNRDLYLNINVCQLVDDLLVALQSFITKLESDSNFANQCDKRLYIIRAMKSYKDLQGNQNYKANIKAQIIKCWGARIQKSL